MYVDYGGDTQHVGMGIKAMKSFNRPRGKLITHFFIF